MRGWRVCDMRVRGWREGDILVRGWREGDILVRGWCVNDISQLFCLLFKQWPYWIFFQSFVFLCICTGQCRIYFQKMSRFVIAWTLRIMAVSSLGTATPRSRLKQQCKSATSVSIEINMPQSADEASALHFSAIIYS